MELAQEILGLSESFFFRVSTFILNTPLYVRLCIFTLDLGFFSRARVLNGANHPCA